MWRFPDPGASWNPADMIVASSRACTPPRPGGVLRMDLLKQAGFARVTVFGNLDGSACDQNAPRLVLLARKI